MKKIRIWDTKLLTDVFAIAAQMQLQLEDIVKQTGVTNLKSLPNSMVPTETLYHLVISYEILYNRLLDADLLNTGNAKQTEGMH
jgi:hypothetical protein